MGEADIATQAHNELGFSRWWQIVAAVVMMALVSPYQYVWSSLQQPLATDLGVSLSALGAVFTLYVIFQSGIQFPAGWLRDRHGPQVMTLIAGLLAGGGYVGLAHANALWQVYLLYSIGAIGVGIVYTVAVNTAVKWFPDQRGLTTGAGTMAFAAGSAFFVPYVRANATVGAFGSVLQNVGLLIGIGVIVGALVLRDPPNNWLDETEDTTAVKENSSTEKSREERSNASNLAIKTRQQYTWREVIQTWQFWLMYVMFVGISGANLMLAANLVPFADNLGLATVVATASATILPIADGLGRLGTGGISDRIGRERSMLVTFTLCGIGLFLLVGLGEIGSIIGFLAAVVIAAGFEGTQYTLFPSIVGDYFGEKHSSTNYAILYSAKMIGGIFGGVAVSWLVGTTGWTTAFLLGGLLAVVAGFGAILLHPPSTTA